MAETPKIYHFAVAFVGPLGSGSTKAADLMKDVLAEEKLHNGVYEVIKIKVSKILENSNPAGKIDTLAPPEKIMSLQNCGNELRKVKPTKVGELILDQLIINRNKTNLSSNTSDMFVFSIIDSLKNPYDFSFLKSIYGNSLLLIGITADRDIRWDRLKKKPGWADKEASFNKIDEIDRDERDEQGNQIGYGQKVEKLFMLADYFIVNNESKGHDYTHLTNQLSRAIKILVRNPFLSPTKDETFMHYAWSAARRSLCMSRQVGAAIVSKSGALLSLGWNDVPKSGGGLYSEVNQGNTEEGRCAVYGKIPVCHNDEQKGIIINELISNVTAEFSETDKEVLSKVFRKSRISDLIEFSRAVHAEMEAIISVARNATNGLIDSTMYVTTMPCHSCARHIVGAGVREVQYIEPYRKSKAVELHGDSINLSNKVKDNQVWFRQYEGLAPSNYLETYEARHERKLEESGLKAPEFIETYLGGKYRLKKHDDLWYTNGEVVHLFNQTDEEASNEASGNDLSANSIKRE